MFVFFLSSHFYFSDNSPVGIGKGKRSSSSSSSDDNIYIAEKIVAERLSYPKGRKSGNPIREFFVKWKGYDDDQNTWEPERNLLHPLLLKEWRQDHPPISKKPESKLSELSKEKKIKKTIQVKKEKLESPKKKKMKKSKEVEKPQKSSVMGGGDHHEEEDVDDKLPLFPPLPTPMPEPIKVSVTAPGPRGKTIIFEEIPISMEAWNLMNLNEMSSPSQSIA